MKIKGTIVSLSSDAWVLKVELSVTYALDGAYAGCQNCVRWMLQVPIANKDAYKINETIEIDLPGLHSFQ